MDRASPRLAAQSARMRRLVTACWGLGRVHSKAVMSETYLRFDCNLQASLAGTDESCVVRASTAVRADCACFSHSTLARDWNSPVA